MYISASLLLFSSTLALALPSPVNLLARDWPPPTDSVTTCDTTADKRISFNVGPPETMVLKAACTAMLPACAYSQNDSDDAVCTQTADWPVKNPQSSTQQANVVDAKTTNKLSGFAVKFSITPPANTTGLLLWGDDCEGYFDFLLTKQSPQGCADSQGDGPGSIMVGASSDLKGTVFKVEIVPEQ